MRPLLLSILLLHLLPACKKHDVDIAAMNTNPFDADNPAGSWIHIDSVYSTGPSGGYYIQFIRFHADPQLVAQGGYSITVHEQGTTGTASYAPSEDDASGEFLHQNTGTLAGNTYCYDLNVQVGGPALTNHHVARCETVGP